MSNGLVLSFFRRASQSDDWSQQELAEFYRVESALLQSGLSVTTDRGRSDEGDPWFVFCRADNDEVIAHFARVDHEYVVASCFHPVPARGRDFRTLIRDMLDLHPLMLPVRRRTGQKVFLHPSALLLAMLASSYFLSNEKEVIGEHGGTGAESRSSLFSFLREKALIITALAVAWLEHHDDPALQSLAALSLFHNSSDEKASHIVAATHDSHLIRDLQLVQNTGLGAHSALLQHVSNELVSTKEDVSQGHVLTGPSTLPTPSHASSPNIDLTTAALDGLVNNYSAGFGHGDGAVGGMDSAAGPQGNAPSPLMGNALALIMGEHQSSASSQLPSGAESSGAVNSLVIPNNEAFQIAQLETSGSSIASGQTVVLSSNPTTVDVALQQAFQQVGFGVDALRNAQMPAAPDALGSSHDPVSDSAVQLSSFPAPEGSANAVGTINPIPVAATSENVGTSASNGSTEVSSTISQPVSAPASPVTPTLSTSPDNTATPSNQVVQIVTTFLEHTPNYEITVSGANIVIIDTSLTDARSPEFGFETFDMADGSTLSIVGIIQHSATLSA